MKCLLLLAIAAPLALVAQTTPNNPFTGTWKLNVAKSKFSPGPAPKSSTVTIEADGKTTVESVTAVGETHNWSFIATEGASAPIAGLPNSSLVDKRINVRTIQQEWNMDGTTLHGRGVVSKNGKTMTYTMTGMTPAGKPLHNVEIYEKQ